MMSTPTIEIPYNDQRILERYDRRSENAVPHRVTGIPFRRESGAAIVYAQAYPRGQKPTGVGILVAPADSRALENDTLELLMDLDQLVLPNRITVDARLLSINGVAAERLTDLVAAYDKDAHIKVTLELRRTRAGVYTAELDFPSAHYRLTD